MPTTWLTTMKPSFQTEWLALPTQDPTPDAKVKKQLKHIDPKLHRIRAGDYRIFYTFEEPHISLLAVRRRRENTYDEDLDIEALGGFDLVLEGTTKAAQPDWERLLAPKEPEKRRLPEPITVDLLTNLRVPKECHARLLPISTEEDLLDCPGVPEDYLLKIDERMFERPLVQVVQQPDYVLQQVDDLLRYKEGELLGFLLKLSPEQEKYVNWGIKAFGPTLLKGGPGTGKSTIALYRVRSLVQQLRKRGRDTFRILFTTYTNALVKSSEQLLQQLLSDDLQYVEVRTADRIAVSLLSQAGAAPKFIDGNELNNLVWQAVKIARFDGNAIQQQAQRQAVERLSIEYLHQEINQVIVARQVRTREEYLAVSRPGRKVRLNALRRKAIWQVYETLQRLLFQQGKATWHQARAQAEEYVTSSLVGLRYDAVIID